MANFRAQYPYSEDSAHSTSQQVISRERDDEEVTGHKTPTLDLPKFTIIGTSVLTTLVVYMSSLWVELCRTSYHKGIHCPVPFYRLSPDRRLTIQRGTRNTKAARNMAVRDMEFPSLHKELSEISTLLSHRSLVP